MSAENPVPWHTPVMGKGDVPKFLAAFVENVRACRVRADPLHPFRRRRRGSHSHGVHGASDGKEGRHGSASLVDAARRERSFACATSRTPPRCWRHTVASDDSSSVSAPICSRQARAAQAEPGTAPSPCLDEPSQRERQHATCRIAMARTWVRIDAARASAHVVRAAAASPRSAGTTGTRRARATAAAGPGRTARTGLTASRRAGHRARLARGGGARSTCAALCAATAPTRRSALAAASLSRRTSLVAATGHPTRAHAITARVANAAGSTLTRCTASAGVAARGARTARSSHPAGTGGDPAVGGRREWCNPPVPAR